MREATSLLGLDDVGVRSIAATARAGARRSPPRDGLRGRRARRGGRADPPHVLDEQAQPAETVRRRNPSRTSRLTSTRRPASSSSPGSSAARKGASVRDEELELRREPRREAEGPCPRTRASSRRDRRSPCRAARARPPPSASRAHAARRAGRRGSGAGRGRSAPAPAPGRRRRRATAARALPSASIVCRKASSPSAVSSSARASSIQRLTLTPTVMCSESSSDVSAW